MRVKVDSGGFESWEPATPPPGPPGGPPDRLLVALLFSGCAWHPQLLNPSGGMTQAYRGQTFSCRRGWTHLVVEVLHGQDDLRPFGLSSYHQLPDEPFALIRLPPLHAANCAPFQWDPIKRSSSSTPGGCCCSRPTNWGIVEQAVQAQCRGQAQTARKVSGLYQGRGMVAVAPDLQRVAQHTPCCTWRATW
jgi:hypothetical protein